MKPIYATRPGQIVITDLYLDEASYASEEKGNQSRAFEIVA
jgi:hypothetical protein